MAGEAKSKAFMLGTATVMLGPSEDVFNLTPDDHAVGLVKDFVMAADTTSLDLTQGVRNSIVYSVVTDFPLVATFNAFEYTARNVAYTLGAEGFQTVFDTKPAGASLKTALVGGVGATIAELTVATDISAQFQIGDWIYIQELDAGRDKVHVAKLTSPGAYTAGGAGLPGTLELLFNDHAVPVGTTFGVGSRVRLSSVLGAGANYELQSYGMKVVGILPEGNEPITVIAPKVRVTKGFNLAFTTSDYGSMPFEVKMLEVGPTDPHYATFRNLGMAGIWMGN